MEPAVITNVVNGIFILLLGIFIRNWMNRVDKTIENMVSDKSCLERKETIEKRICNTCKENEKLWRHQHADTGEVIIPGFKL